jgi:hypothetical protein
MSKQGMIGMELATQEMLGIGEAITDGQWQLPSGAEAADRGLVRRPPRSPLRKKSG